MPSLNKYRRPSAENLTRQYATKLPEKLANEFEAWCRELNITPSEALRLLVLEEIESVRRMKNIQGYQEITDDVERYLAPTLESPPVTPSKPKSTRLPGGSSRSANRWKIGDKLPCPICGKWGAASNFKRDHIEKHGLPYANAPEFLEAYKEEADKMVEALRGNRNG